MLERFSHSRELLGSVIKALFKLLNVHGETDGILICLWNDSDTLIELFFDGFKLFDLLGEVLFQLLQSYQRLFVKLNRLV